MNNFKKVDVTVTKEELQKIKSLDWASYYKNHPVEDSDKIAECPHCEAMIFPQPGQTEMVCRCCKKEIQL